MNSANRQSSSTLYGIQILRGFAAFLVVLFHARYMVGSATIEHWFRNGAAGVDIFFVISGVVMTLTATKLTPTRFMIKRIERIVPLYWLFCLLKLASVYFLAVSARTLDINFTYVFKSFLFIPAYDGDGLVFPLIRAGWTLSFEMYFYIICACALAFNANRFALWTTIVVTAGTIAGLFLLQPSPDPLPAALYILAPISLEFVAGVLLATLWQRGIRLPRTACIILFAVSLLGLSQAPYFEQFDTLRPVLWGLPSLGIVAAVLFLEPHIQFNRWKSGILVGDASYALYLAHTAALPLLHKAASLVVTAPATLFLLLVLLSTCAGIGAHLLIEKPLNRFIKGRAHR